MTLAAIDTGQLLQLVWAAALAGLVVATAFALLILGATRASELRRADRHGPATAYVALAVAAALLFAGTVAYGVSVIVSK
jgi:xanthine/uracil/vitamin C permease (AzgA family)